MLLGPFSLLKFIRKCYKQQHVASEVPQTECFDLEAEREPEQTTRMAAVEEKEAGPSSMDVDASSALNGGEEWTEDEMSFMRSALEQVSMGPPPPPPSAQHEQLLH